MHGNDERPLISFSTTWDILGPFQVGTRGEYLDLLPTLFLNRG